MSTGGSGAVSRSSATSGGQPQGGGRLLYVDNLRIYLTITVVVFHLLVTYSGVGSWYYLEGRQDTLTTILGGWLAGSTQAYFMGFFLLISAFFVPGSYDRKGARRFLLDRLVRLGLPLVVYEWVLRPLLIYLDLRLRSGLQDALWVWLTQRYFPDVEILGAGPLWFIETLLIFSLLYAVWRLASGKHTPAAAAASRFPGNGAILLFTVALAIIAFGVRLIVPMGWSWHLFNLQFPFFAQYIALFVVGLIAYRRGWFASLSREQARTWRWVALGAFIAWAPLALLGGMGEDFRTFAGGWHWQAAAYALWESILCMGMCIGLLELFRRRCNRQSGLGRFLSRHAYAVYLVHGPVITCVALALSALMWHPLAKWVITSLIAVPLCYAVSWALLKVPKVDRVL